MIIAIDGPSGVGKSTVARAVAGARGMQYLDTGATYRAAAVAVVDGGVDPVDETAVVSRVGRIAVDYERGVVTLDGEDITHRVRDADITAAASTVSAYPEVRRVVVEIQREWVGRHPGGVVVEGRDIGSVVFPNASVKVFLTADPDVRAARRARDDETAGVSKEAVARDLARRDHRDSTRDTSPLVVADDAHVIDTTNLGIDAVVDRVLDLVDAAGARPHPV